MKGFYILRYCSRMGMGGQGDKDNEKGSPQGEPFSCSFEML
jgi:hypothetical protein